MDQAEREFEGLELMDGERIEKSISTGDRSDGSSRKRGGSLVLTSNRIILITGAGSGREVMMASVNDVDSVEFVEMTEGYGAFLWAALSVILSFALHNILENEIARILVPLMVLGMGVYLVVNRIFFTGGPAAVFRAGGSAITWSFRSQNESQEIRDFIDGLYRLKSDQRTDNGWPFAPR